MPIFDQGYRHWDGKLSGQFWRWRTVTRRGVLVQIKNRWVILAILGAWMPATLLAAVLLVWALFEQKSAFLGPFLGMLMRALPGDMAAQPASFRSTVWTLAFSAFFQFEIFFSMILVVVVGPDLISRDLRFNAMPLYFAKPLRRIDYFIGKLGVIGAYLSVAAIGPAVVAYLLGVCFSLEFAVIKETLPILLGSLAYGLVVVVSAGTLMLAISSLSRNSRHVGAIWIGLWVISNIVSAVLSDAFRRDWCALLSYTRNLHRLRHFFLDTESAWKQISPVLAVGGGGRDPSLFIGDTHPWFWSVGVLAGLFGLSVCILSLRVKSLDKLK